MLFYIIEQNEVMRKAWEIFLKEEKAQSYTCDCVGDFKFIAEDLKPDFFICEGKTLLLEWDQFFKVVSNSNILKKIPIVSFGKYSEEFEKLNHLFHLDKPLHLQTAYNKIIQTHEES
jgi:hypothetical protein